MELTKILLKLHQMLSGKYYTPKSVLDYIDKNKAPKVDDKFIILANPKYKI